MPKGDKRSYKKAPRGDAPRAEQTSSAPDSESIDSDLALYPELVPMGSDPAEAGIGKRIKYARGQLNNLSVEALARLTRQYDAEGVSAASLIRYESGDSKPGARELRVLCDALGVPAAWLLFGTREEVDTDAVNLLRLLHRVMDKWAQRRGVQTAQEQDFMLSVEELTGRARDADRRSKLLAARRPLPKGT